MSWTILAGIVSILVTLYLYRRRLGNIQYPPGPPGIPVLGNALQLDKLKPWDTFTKWKEVYGPIVYSEMAGQSIVILNTKKVAEDLLERRSSKYSDRPRFIVANEMTQYMDLPIVPYGERWRKMRKASETALGVRVSSNYYGVQTDESVILAYALLNHECSTLTSQIERTSSSVILSLLYDYPSILSLDDPSLAFMNDFIETLSRAMMPGTYLVDVFPILEHLPRWLSLWRRDAEEFFRRKTFKFEQMFLTIKSKVKSGQEQRPSICAVLVETEKRHGMSDQECAWLAGVLYGAGHETTSTTLLWFIFAIMIFQDVQTRAQEELDLVVGRSRLPSFADMRHLPYIRAIVKEVLRWRPATPVGVPHALTEDDYYEGYFIRKGTVIIPNVWCMNRDPDVYGPDGDAFRPERHLDANGDLKDETNEGHFTYGFGHRECVGRHVANNSLFIAMANILWVMRLEPAKDENGNYLTPDVNGQDTNGIFIRPPPFKFTATPRFQDADILIQQARDEIIREVQARSDVL